METEVLSDHGVTISQFPVVIKRSVNRPHSSVTAIVALERALESGDSKAQSALAPLVIENVSHGQLQALSAVPSDNLAFEGDSSFVISPPAILEGRGVVKRFGTKVLVVPMHSGELNFGRVCLTSVLFSEFWTVWIDVGLVWVCMSRLVFACHCA